MVATSMIAVEKPKIDFFILIPSFLCRCPLREFDQTLLRCRQISLRFSVSELLQ